MKNSYASYITNIRNKRWRALAVAIFLLVVCHLAVGGNPLRFFIGIPQMGELLRKLLSPNFAVLGEAGEKLLETLELAIFGTLFGGFFAVFFAFLTAENLGTPKALRRILNGVFSFFRTIPSLIWAGIFVTLFSIGKFSGFLALFIIAFLMGVKFYKEYIEAIPRNRLDSVTALGGGGLKLLFAGVIPKVRGLFVSVFFLCLETNIRSATILGLVGAGGIGQILWRDLNYMRYDKVSVIILVLVLTIYLVDILSHYVRKKVLFLKPPMDLLSYKKRKEYRIFLSFVVALLLGYMVVSFFAVSKERFFAGIETAKIMITRMFHPEWSYAWKGFLALLESLTIALFATVMGSLLSLGTVYLGAENLGCPRWLNRLTKLGVNLLRTFPAILFAIVYFRGVGPGAYAGALALMTYTVGTLSKMVIETVEEESVTRIELLRAIGAGSWKNYLSNVLPGLRGKLVGLILYRLESNVRNSAIIGIIGAGGIGKLLSMNITWRNWERVGLLLLFVAIAIMTIDGISRRLRQYYVSGSIGKMVRP